MPPPGSLFERALAIDETALEPDHPQLVRTLAALADLHCAHGRYAEAEPLFRRLMALRDQGAVYDQWDKMLANWSRLLRETGREGEAAQLRVTASRMIPNASRMIPDGSPVAPNASRMILNASRVIPTDRGWL